MKDTCKQAIFRENTRRAKRAVDLWTAGDQDKGELQFFNSVLYKKSLVQSDMVSGKQGTKVEGHCFFLI